MGHGQNFTLQRIPGGKPPFVLSPEKTYDPLFAYGELQSGIFVLTLGHQGFLGEKHFISMGWNA